MSELPDLDTTQIGAIAYWNAVDQGGLSEDQIDPIPLVDSELVAQFNRFDNGVQGLLSYPQPNASDLTLNFRIKTDGWLLVWDNGNTNYRAGPDSVGHGSLVKGSMATSPEQFPTTLYSDAISTLNSGMYISGNFSHGEVGYYNYDIQSATSLRLAHERVTTPSGLSAISMPSGYEIYHHEITFQASGNGDGTGFSLGFGGETVEQNGYDKGIDTIPAGTIASPETFYISGASIADSGGVSALTTNHVIYMNEVTF